MYNYEKVASSSLKEAKDILRDIYEENPKHWPYGLYPEQMDGGLYLVREASTKEPVGFVGWQERIEDFKKVGYYSVGIKKAHRRSGYAKAAVKKLIQEKSARVDRVKALIVEGNTPSVGLAENLEVEVDMQKSAAARAGLGGALGVGLSAAENKWLGYEPESSKLNLILGALAGAGTGSIIGKGKRNVQNVLKELSPITFKQVGILGIDQLIKSRREQSELADKKLDTASKYQDMAELLSPYEKDPDNPEEQRIKPLFAAGGITAGALGTGAVFASILNALRDKNKITIDNQERKDPNVLSVDIPKDKVSDKFYTNLNRDMLFSTPEEKRNKLKDLLEDLEDSEKQAMEKPAAAIARGIGLLGKGLKAFGQHGAKTVSGAGNRLNPLRSSSLLHQKGIGRLAKQYGLTHGGLYAADATGLSNYLGDGNWGNRFGNYMIEPFKDAARDFRAGNYGHGLVNALYAPLHLAFNVSGASALGKHAIRQGGRGLSALGTTLTRTGGTPAIRGATASGARLTKGQVPTYMQSLRNPNIARTQINPNMSQTQLLGAGLERLGGKMFGSSMAKGNADTLLSPLLQGYGRALGGNNAFGRGLGTAFTATGTVSNAALRNSLAKGGPLSKAIGKSGIGTMLTSTGASLGLPMAALPSGREYRYNQWEQQQAEKLQRRREQIAQRENNLLTNPDFVTTILSMLGGATTDGPQMRGGYNTYGT
mgnify:CR=1 FL=1